MARHPIDLNEGNANTNPHDAFGADTGGRYFPHTGRDWHPKKVGSQIAVYAAEAGTVIAVGGNASDKAGPGLYAIIQQPSGFWLYGHLSSRSVIANQSVNEGQRIGNMGNSGGSLGVHLHVTLFTTRAAALSNAIPTLRAGRSVSVWAAENRLADPLTVINKSQENTMTPAQEKKLLDAIGNVYDHVTHQANVTRGSSNIGWIKRRIGGSYSGESLTAKLNRVLGGISGIDVEASIDPKAIAEEIVALLPKDSAQAVVDELAERLKA